MYSFSRSTLTKLIIATAFSILALTKEGNGQDIVAMVKRVKPSVVSVKRFNSFGLESGEGSGFFIDKNRVITNHHVIKNASAIKIRLNDSSEYSCKHIVALDTAVDIALLEVDIPTSVKITPLIIRKTLPESGEKVYVVGNPLGLEQSVSDGIVSSIRTIKNFGTTKFIQFTAAISPGNSGSPLLDAQGQVLGVARMGMSEGQNLNFAATSEQIKSLKITDSPIAFKPTSKNYGGKLLNVKDAFSVDTTLICSPPSGIGLEEQNAWKIVLAGKRLNWEEEVTTNNIKRLKRAITRNYEKFDITKDTLSMSMARSVIYESMGSNNPNDTLDMEDRERVKGMQYGIAKMMASMYLRGDGKPTAYKTAVIKEENNEQLWVELKAGTRYFLFTLADSNEIADIDVAVFQRKDNLWTPIGSDTDEDSFPQTSFLVESSGEYAVVWRVAKYAQGKTKGLFTSIISEVE
jgi:S1-C subfamily serine protease